MAQNAASLPERKATLERWIDCYADALLKTCYVYLHNLPQAEDAVQDTFVKAYQRLAHQDAKAVAAEKAWLMRIAINICHDYHRSRWFRYVDKTIAVENLPQNLMSVLPQDHDLLSAVFQLPEKLKQVLLLYYYQELTLQETAAILQISRSAVHKRLQKAQMLLKGRLEGRDLDA